MLVLQHCQQLQGIAVPNFIIMLCSHKLLFGESWALSSAFVQILTEL